MAETKKTNHRKLTDEELDKMALEMDKTIKRTQNKRSNYSSLCKSHRVLIGKTRYY